MGQFLGLETEIIVQFPGPETDFMGEKYFMKDMIVKLSVIIKWWF